MSPAKTQSKTPSKAPRAHPVLSKGPTTPGGVENPGSDKVQLPHERDESTGGDATSGPGSGAAGEDQRRVGQRAARDLAEGQVDTDMHATPGLDAEARRKAVAKPATKRRG